MTIADFGMGQAVCKVIAEYESNESKKKKSNFIISTSLMMSVIICGVIFIINLILSFYIGEIIKSNIRYTKYFYCLNVKFFNVIYNYGF